MNQDSLGRWGGKQRAGRGEQGALWQKLSVPSQDSNAGISKASSDHTGVLVSNPWLLLLAPMSPGEGTYLLAVVVAEAVAVAVTAAAAAAAPAASFVWLQELGSHTASSC